MRLLGNIQYLVPTIMFATPALCIRTTSGGAKTYGMAIYRVAKVV